MTDKEEIAFWKKAKMLLQKEIRPKHGIEEMDLSCSECKAAIMVAFINERLEVLEWGRSIPDDKML